jgi:hypothetical protein
VQQDVSSEGPDVNTVGRIQCCLQEEASCVAKELSCVAEEASAVADESKGLRRIRFTVREDASAVAGIQETLGRIRCAVQEEAFPGADNQLAVERIRVPEWTRCSWMGTAGEIERGAALASCTAPLPRRPSEQRRRSESNRRMEVLQTSALPLGYGAGRTPNLFCRLIFLKVSKSAVGDSCGLTNMGDH